MFDMEEMATSRPSFRIVFERMRYQSFASPCCGVACNFTNRVVLEIEKLRKGAIVSEAWGTVQRHWDESSVLGLPYVIRCAKCRKGFRIIITAKNSSIC